ncbi:MAG: HlyD family secretion protein [Rhodospirillales bacterium]|jgi:membrane fusion protein (multidrug efflux system)|nr:HlyD family secretion protein [Rhodospirillales bacterium]
MDDVRSAPKDLATGPGGVSLPRRSGRPRARLAVLLIALALIGGAIGYWWLTRNEVTTDDAFIDGHAVTVAPQVAGKVDALLVHDNQRVTAGQKLIEIDPRSYQAARDQAQARLEQAQALAEEAAVTLAQIRITAPAKLAAARASLATAQADARKADTDWRRQLRMPRQATTQQAIDDATATHLAAAAAVARAQAALQEASTVSEQIAAAEARLHERRGAVALARAELETAALDLARTTVRAPQAGWITKRNVEQGNFVQPGQAILALVTRRLWVTANFKETALDRIRPGQRVRIHVDAYPELKLVGHVDSIQHGTGSRFSAFPAENATGNYVKIVQRVPVRIDIDSGLDPTRPLPLGLSVEPTIRVR